ncbi:MAG: hypothetical protein ACXWWI_10155 [Nitrospira sp.]
MRVLSRPVPEGLISLLMKAGVLRLCPYHDRAKPTPLDWFVGVRLFRMLSRISPWG